MRPFGLDDDDIELAYILDRNLVTSFAIVDCLQTQKPRKLGCYPVNIRHFSILGSRFLLGAGSF